MLRIAIIDDEEIMLLGISKIIENFQKGYKVAGCYSSGTQALQEMDIQSIDVIITDIMMPGISGLEFVRQVKQLKKELYVIIVSGFNDFEFARSAIRFGVIDYLLKPVNIDELGKILDELNGYFQVLSSSLPVELEEQQANALIDEVKKFVEAHYAEDIDLSTIAEQAFLSPNYLSRKFKNETGQSLSDYLIHYRLNKAKELLRSKRSLKVYEISMQVGYPDPMYFNKLFKKNEGMTPKEFQQNSRIKKT